MSAAVARIETPERFKQWSAEFGYALIHADGSQPALVWQDDNGEWRGIRPVSEDDGPWSELPEAIRHTHAVPVGSIAPDGYGDELSFTPFTVLWSA